MFDQWNSVLTLFRRALRFWLNNYESPRRTRRISSLGHFQIFRAHR